MLQTWRKPAKLFSDFNTLQFAGVMGMVLLAVLFLFMPISVVCGGGIAVDLPKVIHPTSMAWADREDAMIVNVTRDGRVYFGSEQVVPHSLPVKIADRLKDHSVERKLYIKADMRARYGVVKQVLDGARAAGLLRVAFLVDQRRPTLISSTQLP